MHDVEIRAASLSAPLIVFRLLVRSILCFISVRKWTMSGHQRPSRSLGCWMKKLRNDQIKYLMSVYFLFI